ncbi:MAG: xylulokinase [Anaerolineae bacterium]|nr:xylulokinase [Anaerolineae bacterium]
MAYFLGIDVGTTGSKSLLITEKGQVTASATVEYPMYTPQPQWAEQNPQDWWQATVESIRKVLTTSQVPPDQVMGVGLTGQMHGLVLLNKEGAVLRPCIMWNDQRTGPQCAWITERVGPQRVLQLTGNPVLPGFTAPKIIWVREHEPEIYEQVAKVLLPKDYIRYRLTGEFATEVSDASGTSLFDVGRRRWSQDMLEALDIPAEWLPECYESPVVSGYVSQAVAEVTGLKAGTPVVGGGGDQAAQAVGSGIIETGLISVTIGTSGVVFASTDEFVIEPEGRLHAFCHAVPGKWHLMGVMLSAGGSFRWFRDTLGQTEKEMASLLGQDPYELLTAEAASAPAGCEGLLFLPYLTGERTPYPDPNARGVFMGLTLRHDKRHLVRAVLEGVAYGLRDSLELMKNLGTEIHQVRASGGGARSELWRQILADVFDSELVVINVTEGAAYGAALLAGVGAGVYKDVAEACRQTIEVVQRTEPVPENTALYRELYPVYRTLYSALKPSFDQVSHIATKRAS